MQIERGTGGAARAGGRSGICVLCGLAGEGMDRTRREQLWAVANNAALLRFSLKEGAYPVFDSAVELLHRMELGQIARLAQQYQQRFEERA